MALKKQRKIINSLQTKFPSPRTALPNKVKERRTATTHQSRAAVTDYTITFLICIIHIWDTMILYRVSHYNMNNNSLHILYNIM